jgi:hypothetical protein
MYGLTWSTKNGQVSYNIFIDNNSHASGLVNEDFTGYECNEATPDSTLNSKRVFSPNNEKQKHIIEAEKKLNKLPELIPDPNQKLLDDKTIPTMILNPQYVAARQVLDGLFEDHEDSQTV